MKEYEQIALQNQKRAREIVNELGLIEFFERNGCKANLVGSLEMGLLVKHLDIDLHVYSPGLTEEKSFGLFSVLSKTDSIKEIRCINGLSTDEHCIAWHLTYEDKDKRPWQIDIIHIESGTQYDGFFERMAARIKKALTAEQRDTILRLKYETPENETIHGVEYYQAVMEYGVSTITEMREWVKKHRKPEGSYWMPK